MPVHDIELTEIAVPDFGLPAIQPSVSGQEYTQRVAQVRARMVEEGLTHLIVYGDREHFVNLMYLTGFDPRFEEAMLILGQTGRPRLLVGNEGFDYAQKVVEIEHTCTLYQSFSLLGQWRDTSSPLRMILEDEGFEPGKRVGTVGWKSYDVRENPHPPTCIEIPAYIVDVLREAVGDWRAVTNAGDLFTHPETGFRITNSADQLAVFEFGATFASQGIRNMTEQVEPGKTELAIVEEARLNGLPLSCHPVVNAGPRAPQLGSPRLRAVEIGDPFMMAIGLWGGLSARAGFVVHDESELPMSIQDYVEVIVKPYYAAAVAWYETIGIGVTGGEIYTLIEEMLADHPFRMALNPGHAIHLDEWVHSGIYPRSTCRLSSGMALQLDIIPMCDDEAYFTINVEDGIALADASLRSKLSEKHPETWSRIQARRQFMHDTLGIHLKEEVLPFSNMPAVLRPYLLSPHLALRVNR
jgi:hypothetical protein